MDKNWKEWMGLKSDKAPFSKKSKILLLLAAGLLLVVIAVPSTDTEIENTTEETSVSPTISQNQAQEYGEYLEKRIAKALEYVEGVGKTEIVITLESNGQKIVEKDYQSDSQKTQEEDANGGIRNTDNTSSERTSVYTQEENGVQTPYVTEEILPQIEGVLVIAEGGDSPVVVQNITEAIQALFGVEAHKIKIMKRTDTY